MVRNESDPYKQLWAETPSEEVRLKQYRFVDEGPTVLVMLDLNEHLPIGDDASAAVAEQRRARIVQPMTFTKVEEIYFSDQDYYHISVDSPVSCLNPVN